MRPVIGPAPVIIAQALRLGLLCRPTHSSRVAYGEALEVSKDLFWLRNGHDEEAPVFFASPEELCMDWELTTMDLIRSEWRKEAEIPW
jgi:hypothetical protein